VITVNNLGPALAVGNKFKIFSGPIANGNLLNIIGGGSGIVWTNMLLVDGSIQVASTPAPTQPPGFTAGSVSILPSGNISLTATGAIGASYKLYASTNVALTPVTSTWTLLQSGTVSTSPFTLQDLNATNFTRRFYIFTP